MVANGILTTCSRAAKGGHLEVLKWARENGCEWDSDTCANAQGGFGVRGKLVGKTPARHNGSIKHKHQYLVSFVPGRQQFIQGNPASGLAKSLDPITARRTRSGRAPVRARDVPRAYRAE